MYNYISPFGILSEDLEINLFLLLEDIVRSHILQQAYTRNVSSPKLAIPQISNYPHP